MTEEENKTLYCFRLNPETGDIETIVIPKYIMYKVSTYTSRVVYTFDNCISNDGKTYRMPGEKLNRFVNNKLFTFNPSYEDAYEFIRNTLSEKSYELSEKLDETTRLIANVIQAETRRMKNAKT